MADLRVPMPKLSMTMEEGELVGWRKAPGDQVRSGEVLCEVMSDKVEMEVEAPADGVVAKLLVEEGATVPVGAPIATITTDADDLIGDLLDPAPPPTAGQPPAEEARQEPAAGAAATAAADVAPADSPPGDTQATPRATPPEGTPPASRQEAPATSQDTPQQPRQGPPAPEPRPAPRRGGLAVAPAARRRAAELGVDLGTVTGTGPRGLIRVQDVEAAAASATAAPTAAAAPRLQPPPGGVRRAALRAAIARRMTPSAAVPQFTVFGELDLEAMAERRDGVSWTALLLSAAARALRDHPQLNASWQNDQLVAGEALRVAVAVDTPNGLLAPVVDAPDQLPLHELDQALRAMVDRAKLGKLTLADQQPATFTLSNLGPLGVPAFQALLTPPQAAALSVGAVQPRPVVRDGQVVARLGCQVGLTVDHRVADGADAARYLATLREQVENP